MSISCHFRALWGMVAFGPLDPPFEVMALRLRLVCIAAEIKDDICTEYFHNRYANSPLRMQIISQIQTTRSGIGVEAV